MEFSSDEKMQQIEPLTREFFEQVLSGEYESVFVGDEATIWDVSMETPEELLSTMLRTLQDFCLDRGFEAASMETDSPAKREAQSFRMKSSLVLEAMKIRFFEANWGRLRGSIPSGMQTARNASRSKRSRPKEIGDKSTGDASRAYVPLPGFGRSGGGLCRQRMLQSVAICFRRGLAAETVADGSQTVAICCKARRSAVS
jgi:hypothetical protein